MCDTGKAFTGNVFQDVTGISAAKEVMGINAASDAAAATEAAAKAQQERATNASQMSPQQLAILDKQTSATLQNLDQQQQLLATVDPALMELGKQTLAMLKGDTSVGAAGIYGKQRAEQETQLRNQLRSSLGSGYENTTAGQAALSNFQRQSSEGAYATATSNIPTLANIYGQGINNSMSSLGNINSAYQNSTNARVNAITGTGNGVIQSSGSQYAGDIATGQLIKGLGGAAIQGYTSGLAGGSKPPGFASGGNYAGSYNPNADMMVS